MPFGQHQDTELWNNQIPDYDDWLLDLSNCSRVEGLSCLSADQNARGLWERDWYLPGVNKLTSVFHASVLLFHHECRQDILGKVAHPQTTLTML